MGWCRKTDVELELVIRELRREATRLRIKSRRGKPNKKPHGAALRERAARSQEAKSDATLSEFERALVRKRRMRPFFAKHYKGFAEHYAEKHEDLGWNQAYGSDDSAPDHDARGDGSLG